MTVYVVKGYEHPYPSNEYNIIAIYANEENAEVRRNAELQREFYSNVTIEDCEVVDI